MSSESSFPFRSTTVCLLLIGAVAFFTRQHWLPSPSAPAAEATAAAPPDDGVDVLRMSPQARNNLGLIVRPAKPQTYWRTIQIPGAVVDRPGRSDRGVTSPAVGVVSQVHAFPGDTVRPGQRLFAVRLFSEYLQNTQKQLFSSTKETELLHEQLGRLRPLVEKGAIAETKVIELENQLRRQAVIIKAHRQDLLTRGLYPEQVDSVARGEFVAQVDVVAPPISKDPDRLVTIHQAAWQTGLDQQDDASERHDIAWEVQELHAELGQQVQAGQLLATLANHSALYIEGHAFKRESPWLEQAAQHSWPLRIDFAEDNPDHWPALEQSFQIRYLSNAIDTESRTFNFYIPLTNQSRSYRKNDETFVVWRFRPGQRLRLHVPVEEMKDVLVLPAGAVVREGPESWVFQQNGNLFNRLSVHVLHEDRTQVVISNDGSVTPGLYLARNAAATLNRVLKAQASSGAPANYHVHADGTVHAAH